MKELGDGKTELDNRSAQDRFKPRPHDETSLRRFLSTMRCPQTRESLWLDAEKTELVSLESSKRWDCRNFVPRMFDGLDVKSFPVEHLSNSLAPKALSLVTESSGLVLNLSAGGSAEWFPNVVEVEAGIFRNTDVVADAHNLPFHDESFSLCIAMNAFEHYHTPEIAASEIYRVLQPGGVVFIHTAFLQPLHEDPFHFFNATPFGVSRWFRDFKDIEISTPLNFNPVYGLSWIMSELDAGLRVEGKGAAADLVAELRISDLMTFWRDSTARQGAAWNAFFAASEGLQGRLAAGVEMIARKPPK